MIWFRVYLCFQMSREIIHRQEWFTVSPTQRVTDQHTSGWEILSSIVLILENNHLSTFTEFGPIPTTLLASLQFMESVSICCPSMKVWVWHWPQQKILIIVWQMLTDLSRVRKYRRLKPFLFITVVIMVNVYSTLNFRGPPTPPFFFFREWSTSLLLWPGWGSTCTTGPDSNGLLLFYPIKLRSQFVRFIVWKFSLCPKCIFLNLLSS